MTTTIALAGDVMTGRGIDQILAHPGDPALHEPYVSSATTYVALAEDLNGPIPRRVDPSYVWGDALDALTAADLRIVNLETAVTTSGAFAPKGINYRMNPANVDVLDAAGIDGCVLANNHVLDWGTGGLDETLGTLRKAGVATAGAGRDRQEALAPAILTADRRVVVLAYAATSSGVPADWAAGPRRPGIAVLADLSERTAEQVAAHVRASTSPEDIVVVSLHWGPNWGYEVPGAHRSFVRRLVGAAGVSIVFGHSSHHPLGIEVVDGTPVLYGAGDFLNDYEGIGGHAELRPDLTVLFRATFSETELVSVTLLPFRIRRFRLERASSADTGWQAATLGRECRRLGSDIAVDQDASLRLRW